MQADTADVFERLDDLRQSVNVNLKGNRHHPRAPLEHHPALSQVLAEIDAAKEAYGDRAQAERVAAEAQALLDHIKNSPPPRAPTGSARSGTACTDRMSSSTARALGGDPNQSNSAPRARSTPDSRALTLATSQAVEARTAAEPDTSGASRFLKTLIREDAAGETYTFQTFDDSERKRPKLAKILHGKGNAAALTKLNRASAGIFNTVNATDGAGRTERNVKRVRAVFVDADKDGAAVLAAIRAAGLPPHAIVESSPGKYHVYWLVERSFPMEKFTALQMALAAKFGTDPKVKDLPRVMRLPGFFHMKDPAHPFMVRIVELREELEPYSLDQIIEGLGLELLERPESKAPAATAAASDLANVTDETIEHLRSALAVIPSDDRDLWVRFLHALKPLDERGRELALEWSQKSTKFDAEDFDRVWDSARGDRTGRAAIFAEAQRNYGWVNPKSEEARQHEDVADLFDDLGPAEEPTSDKPAPRPNVVPYSAFCADRKAPRYVWQRVLQRGALYGLTARWGHGKTAVMLTVVQHAAVGRALGGHRMERCRCLYLCGENPADVRLRGIAGAQYFGISAEELDAAVFFTQRPFAIDNSKALAGFLKEAAPHGPFGLVVIDTGPAHSAAEQENDNREMHVLAIAMRALIEPLGDPAVVALMHPTKEASRDNLQPRGGGAFSGSIDGELCAWAADGVVELFHRQKFRGPGFAPMFFRLEGYELPGVVDNFGDPVATVLAVETDKAPRRHREPKGPTQQLVWQLAHELTEIDGQSVGTDELISAVAAKLPYDPAKKDNRRRDALRALNSLRAGGFVTIEDDKVWAPNE